MDVQREFSTKYLGRYPIVHQATLIKYIHGWLATKKMRFHKGAFRESKCSLCGAGETKEHFLQCFLQLHPQPDTTLDRWYQESLCIHIRVTHHIHFHTWSSFLLCVPCIRELMRVRPLEGVILWWISAISISKLHNSIF